MAKVKMIDQVMSEVAAGAVIIVSSDAMGRSSYFIEDVNGERRPLNKQVGNQINFFMLRRLEDSTRTWGRWAAKVQPAQ